MAYKTLLTVTTGPAPVAGLLDAAVQLARREDAHLEVISLGVDRIDLAYAYAGVPGVLPQETLSDARADATQSAKSVKDRLAAEDVRWSSEAAIVQQGLLGQVVGDRARFADLLVTGRPFGRDRGGDCTAVLEGALFAARTPALIVPGSGLANDFADRIVLAWNRSPEALSAARAALPFLKRAAVVSVAVIDPPSVGAERSDPGGALSQWLSRHGVKVEVAVLARTAPTLSEVLLRHVRDVNAGMVVMGAYGHSRFREAVFGGMTREMLEMDGVPLLMAH
jgi:nucleotide-binding universal stress UspA family protein